MPIALVLLNPAVWAAAAEAALWTAAAVGTVVVAISATESVRERARTRDDVCTTCTQARPCPPCTPPVGTVQGVRIDRVPPSAPHFPCTGDHLHTRVMRQDPRSCTCFWNRGTVDCLPQGGSSPHPMGH